VALDINNITLDSIGDLPLIVKWVIIAVLCVAILAGGFWFLNKPQLEQLDREKVSLSDLKQEFEAKQHDAASLKSYQQQMVKIKRTFGVLLRKLPSKTEVPALLEDISNAGVSSGLRFTSFKPLPENIFSFYAELPVEITVLGDYHQLAEFVSKISALDRIVTVHDFSITKGELEKNPGGKPNESPTEARIRRMAGEDEVSALPAGRSPKVDESNLLNMRMVIMTYRYKEESEGEEDDLGGGLDKKSKDKKAKK